MPTPRTPRSIGAGPEPKKRASGPSGAHRTPRRFLGLPAEAWDLVDRATAEQPVCEGDWGAWVRGVLAMAVADELGLEPETTIALFDRE